MNKTLCPREHEVVNAMKSGQWIEELHSHTEGCPACREAMMLVGTMPRLADLPVAHPLPSHRLIWLKAQYARRQQRVSNRDLIGLSGMTVVGTTILLGIVVWRFPKLFPGVVSTIQSSIPETPGGMSVTTPLIVFIVLVVFAWLITRDRFLPEK